MNLTEQAEPVLEQHFVWYDYIDFDPAPSALQPDLLYCQATNFKSYL